MERNVHLSHRKVTCPSVKSSRFAGTVTGKAACRSESRLPYLNPLPGTMSGHRISEHVLPFNSIIDQVSLSRTSLRESGNENVKCSTPY